MDRRQLLRRAWSGTVSGVFWAAQMAQRAFSGFLFLLGMLTWIQGVVLLLSSVSLTDNLVMDITTFIFRDWDRLLVTKEALLRKDCDDDFLTRVLAASLRVECLENQCWLNQNLLIFRFSEILRTRVALLDSKPLLLTAVGLVVYLAFGILAFLVLSIFTMEIALTVYRRLGRVFLFYARMAKAATRAAVEVT